ncbi:MAG: glycosyl hydrolase 108 family protein [Candidatus Angelobacter sp.]
MADFKPAFEFVLQHEDSTRSGRVTVDAGGRTRFGIAAKFHPELGEEFFTGPPEDALAQAERIEEHDYWDPMRLAEVENQNAANKLFDMAVNMGVRQAAVYAQRAANLLLSGQAAELRLVEDGAIGEKSLAAINRCEPANFHQLLCQLSEAHYRHVAAVNPAQAVNLHGWLKRASA